MEKLMTQQEVAATTGIPHRTLANWRYLGRGPRYTKLGQHVRYRLSDVQQWIDENGVEPGSGDAA